MKFTPRKELTIGFRVTHDEHKKLFKEAQTRGFDSVSHLVRFVLRKFIYNKIIITDLEGSNDHNVSE